jgi:Zn-dependent protease
MGLVMMVIFKIGWAKPVPVNMRKFRNPKRGMAITAAAGPISNLLISIIAMFIYGLLAIPFSKLGDTGSYILQMIYLTAYISIALAIFNIIPIPPLDGSKVLYAFLSDTAYLKLMRLERYGMIILVALIFLLNNQSINPLSTATSFVFDKLFIVAQWGFDIVNKLVK